MSHSGGRLIIIGAGELSNYLIHESKSYYEEILAVTKTEERHSRLKSLGAHPTTEIPEDIKPDDDVLFSVPGSLQQMEVIGSLKWKTKPRRAILISSVGIYGTPQGMVTEITPRDDSPRADQIMDTEKLFRDKFGYSSIVLRAGGLYSEFKGPFVAFIKKQSASIGPPNRTLTLLHYHDLALAVLGALRHQDPDGLYNVVSWPSPTREEFYEEAARRLKIEAPKFSEPLPHAPAQYDITALRSDLLPIPKYPDWRNIFN